MVADSDRDRQTLNRCQCWQRRGQGTTTQSGQLHTRGRGTTTQSGQLHTRGQGTATQSGQLHTRGRGLPHSRDSSTQEDGDYHTVGTAPHKRTGTTTQSGQLHKEHSNPHISSVAGPLTLTHPVWTVNPH